MTAKHDHFMSRPIICWGHALNADRKLTLQVESIEDSLHLCGLQLQLFKGTFLSDVFSTAAKSNLKHWCKELS